MKSLIFILLFLLTHVLFASNSQNYLGTIGKYKVVFHLEKGNKNTVLGYYYYENRGINITIKGISDHSNITIYEIDSKGDTSSIIKMKQLGNKLVGTWKKKKSRLTYNVSLIETKYNIPDIPSNIEGVYVNNEETKCNLQLTISFSEGEYFYKLKTPIRTLSDKVTFFRDLEEQKVYINLEGIEWAESLGSIDENGNPKNPVHDTQKGIEGELAGDYIYIQNYGNSMNYYVKLEDCKDKYVFLKKP